MRSLEENSEGQGKRRDFVPMLFFLIIGILMFLSMTLLVNGISRWRDGDLVSMAYVAMGISGLLFSAMNITTFQNRIRRVLVGRSRVLTVLKCLKCGFELKRNFKEGDYIYGQGESCPSCKSQEPLIITSIYVEKPVTRARLGQ